MLSTLTACTFAAPRIAPSPTPLPAPTQAAALTVVWAEEGDLFLWQAGGGARALAGGGVVRPYLSPDGRRVAFTRGQRGAAESLWVVDRDSFNERQLAGSEQLEPVRDGSPRVGAVGWIDSTTLLFNTVQEYEQTTMPQDDLYRADADTGKTTHLLERGRGGMFYVSPDGRYAAVVSSGGIGGSASGTITRLDLSTLAVREVLSFRPSGESEAFYPRVDWQADSQAMRTAIPTWNAPGYVPPTSNLSVTLWRIGADGVGVTTGIMQADARGLPRWSSDAAYTLYLQATEGDRLRLVLADGNGANGEVYAALSPEDAAEPPRWLPGGHEFIYAADGAYWLGAPGAQPRRLRVTSSPVLAFPYLVYAGSDTPPDLRFIRLDDQDTPEVLARVNRPQPVVDAVVGS